MRISDNMKYTVLQQGVNKVQQQLNKLQTELSTEKTVNTPSDDPIKFATSVAYDAELSASSQFSTNLQQLSTLSSMYGTCFDSMSSQLTDLISQANNFGTMDQGLQESASEVVKGIIEQLVTVANTKLGDTYIFGGQQAGSAPFQLNNDYSVTNTTNVTAEDAMNIDIGKSETSQYGISGRAAFYGSSKIAYGSVGNTYTGDIYSNTSSFAYVIDATNNTINVGGTNMTLTSGVYTGSGLAKEIGSQLGTGYSVAFDSTTRKFVISNDTGSDVTFRWSTSNSASTLGFNNVDTVVAAGATEKSDLDTGRKSFLIKINTSGGTTGALASRAQYSYSIDGGATYTTVGVVSTGGADGTGDITITTGSNDTIYVNNAALTLAQGTYTGATLATQIKNVLDPLNTGSYSVNYDDSTRKFSIVNNTGGVVVFNWSNTGSTAAGVLGFDNVDSVVSNGATDTSDYDAGMFIDGSGVANATNNRIKLSFSTGTTDALTTKDTFQIKDLSLFDLLTNFKNAFDAGDTTWVSKNSQYLDDAQALITKSASVVAFQGSQATTLLDNYKTKDSAIQTMQSNLVGADTSQLGVELSTLMNTYQALLSTMSKVLSINILNYLK